MRILFAFSFYFTLLPLVFARPTGDLEDVNKACRYPVSTEGAPVGAQVDAAAKDIARLGDSLLELSMEPQFGARKIMAVMYQSCHVLEKGEYDDETHGGIPGWALDVYPSREFPGRLDRIIPVLSPKLESRLIAKGVIPTSPLMGVINSHYYLKDWPNPRAACHDAYNRCIEGLCEQSGGGPLCASANCLGNPESCLPEQRECVAGYERCSGEANRCVDLSRTPVLYEFGAKLEPFDANNRVINLHTEKHAQGAPYFALDCSGFVSAALAASGLRVRPNDDSYGSYGIGAKDYMDLGRKDDCFETVDFKSSSLRAGDVISWSKHIVMIDQVGTDPFGLKDVTRCTRDQIDPRKFNFSILQSSISGNLGVNRMEARKFFSKNGIAVIEFLALQACRAKLYRENPPQADPRQKNRRKKKEPVFQAIVHGYEGRAASIIRHVGEKKAGCTAPPEKRLKILNDECIQGCFRKHLLKEFGKRLLGPGLDFFQSMNEDGRSSQ
ncbi:MAG: hypothetical protein AB1540_14780 [Bdellovibrionota bacterium]